MPSPIPLVEPVTTAVLPFSINLSIGVAMWRRDPIPGRRPPMRRIAAAAQARHPPGVASTAATV